MATIMPELTEAGPLRYPGGQRVPAVVLLLSQANADLSRGGVGFAAMADGECIACFVSQEALRDHFGGNEMDRASLIEVLHAKQSRIRSTVRGKIADGALEPDGSLVLRSADFWI
jgi:hypothetical protein